MKSYMRRFAVLVPIVFLVGCAMPSMSMRERLLRDGYPPAYAEGFEAARFRGWPASPFKDKDENRYAKDRSYAQGWDDGCQLHQSYDELKFERDHSPRFEFLKRNDD